jgi:hypothetical protein
MFRPSFNLINPIRILTWNTLSLSYEIFSILVTSSLYGAKMFLRTMLTYILSLRRFSNVRDQVSKARTKQHAKLRPGAF